ncbi:hypothetical protein FA09DRAFT_340184 [Tilletiopsis washingtonensis]|uniref:Uncharacterized protein n=1 Tax=Tilletiopsis washingtonensis TaxID=58919 RepID=A0A316Z827_9BASI|nr:hypothetical protein FA09DRAFT_340184 [Tilletiopsis washingtonensis]PWN96385.1 hypothetical protein FA09DRAFT_340184 [Tilletiopsis washingtonensis]
MEAMRKIKVLDGCVKVWSTPFAEWPSQAREALARDPCAPWLPLWHDHIRLKLVFVPPSEPVISSTAAGRAALATSSAAALLPPTKQIAALPAALKAPRTLIKSSPCASLVKLPALNSQGEEIGRAAASEMAASEAVAQEQDVAEEAALEEEGPEASPGAYDQLLELEADASRATQEWVLEQQRSASAATRPASGAAVAVMPAKRPRTEAEPPVRAVASSSRAPSTAAPTSEDPSLPTSVSAILNHKRLFQLSCRIPRGDGGSDKLDEFLLFLSSLEEDGVLEPTKCSYKRAKKALYRFVELAFEVSLDLGSAESDTYELIHALGQDALAAMKDLD